MIIIDVRTPEEYSEGHVGSAINLPLNQLEAGVMPSVGLNEKIILYCRSGGRAGRAKKLLESYGFVNVTNAGGMHDVQQ